PHGEGAPKRSRYRPCSPFSRGLLAAPAPPRDDGFLPPASSCAPLRLPNAWNTKGSIECVSMALKSDRTCRKSYLLACQHVLNSGVTVTIVGAPALRSRSRLTKPSHANQRSNARVS